MKIKIDDVLLIQLDEDTCAVMVVVNNEGNLMARFNNGEYQHVKELEKMGAKLICNMKDGPPDPKAKLTWLHKQIGKAIDDEDIQFGGTY